MRSAEKYIQQHTALEKYFTPFRNRIIGSNQTFISPSGNREILYADWTASGRAYLPIEKRIQEEIMPFIGNTHSGSTITGSLMSEAYERSKEIIKKHVHAKDDDVLIYCGSGTTSAVNKLQRMLGLRIQEKWNDVTQPGRAQKPVVFVSHMEHHSNYISWLETIADVEIINRGGNGNTDLEHFDFLLKHYANRKMKIAAVTACSNVTGIQTPVHAIAKMIHAAGGFCFVDYACSAPYAEINMHPADKDTLLDAIYFSPHKFLGGPGTPGVLIMNRNLYQCKIPDQPGGGTVIYTNPWKSRVYCEDPEQREDGGTPPFLQAIKAAMCINLKEDMGVEQMVQREKELLDIIFRRFDKIRNVQVLEENVRDRLGVISFLVQGMHYNLFVKLLNDRFGIQTRGGCSCAGPYGHLLLNVDRSASEKIRQSIVTGDYTDKPGWVRLSIHPVMTDTEAYYIMDAIENTALNGERWSRDYRYDPLTNEFVHGKHGIDERSRIDAWFTLDENCSVIGKRYLKE